MFYAFIRAHLQVGLLALVLQLFFPYTIGMKVWGYRLFTFSLPALLVTLSAGVCVAQNPVKELPQAMFKTKAVPYAVNPALPAALRENFATGVLRPSEAVAAQRAAAANMLHVPAGTLNVPAGVQNAPAGNTAAGTTNRAQTGRVRLQAAPLAPTNPQRITPKRSKRMSGAVQEQSDFMEEQTRAEDTGTNLTGVQVLQTYFPTWRQELGGMFSKEQLDAVEKAFAATDDFIFVRGEDGELKVRNKDEWDYQARFLTFLKDSGMGFTELQIKQLLGTRGIRGFTLSGPLKTATLQGYMTAYGKIPQDRIIENNRLVPAAKYTPEQQRETELGQYYRHVISANHCPSSSVPLVPYVQALAAKYRAKAVPKTPQQYLEEMEAFVARYNRIPRTEIFREGKKIQPADFTPQEKAEYQLAHGVNGILNRSQNAPTPVSIRLAQIKEQYRQVALATTPDEVLAEAEQFLAQYERMPIFYFAPANEAELTERKLAQRINHALQNSKPEYAPAVNRLRALKEANRTRAVSLGDEELLSKVTDFIDQYKRWPRRTIRHGGNILPLDKYSPEEQEEIQLGRAAGKRLQIRDVAQFPALQKLATVKETYRKHAAVKTPEEHLADLQHFIDTYHRYPNTYIINPTPAQKAEIALANNVAYNIHAFAPGNAAAAQLAAIKEQYRRYAVAMSHQELYQQLLEFLHQNKCLPSSGPLYKSMWGRLNRSTPQNGLYADPWLQKIYELKIAVQNAPEGKFTITPDGQGNYTLEMEQPAVEEDVTAPHKVEELAPAAPSPNIIRLRVTEKTKTLIEAVRDHAALQRREFPDWLRTMHSAENLPQIVDQNTFDALHVLNRAINFDYRNNRNRPEVTYLLETINNYVGLLGEQEEGFYKLIYRAPVADEMLPAAGNFHVVAEEQGMSWAGELAPQVEKVNRLHMLAVKEGTPYSVYLDGDDEMVTGIGIEPKVPAKTVRDDLQTTLKYLLPPGYTVRMGMHEIGVSGKDLTKFRKGFVHIHLEYAAPGELDEGLQIDHSISLDIKAGRFAVWYNKYEREWEPFTDKVIAQNYLALFDTFLDDEARTFLQKLAGSTL